MLLRRVGTLRYLLVLSDKLYISIKLYIVIIIIVIIIITIIIIIMIIMNIMIIMIIMIIINIIRLTLEEGNMIVVLALGATYRCLWQPGGVEVWSFRSPETISSFRSANLSFIGSSWLSFCWLLSPRKNTKHTGVCEYALAAIHTRIELHVCAIHIHIYIYIYIL